MLHEGLVVVAPRGPGPLPELGAAGPLRAGAGAGRGGGGHTQVDSAGAGAGREAGVGGLPVLDHVHPIQLHLPAHPQPPRQPQQAEDDRCTREQ